MPTPPPPSPAAARSAGTTRRELLADGWRLGVLGAVGTGAAACSDPRRSGDASSPGSTSPSTVAATDADEELVGSVLAAVATTRALVTAVRRRRPALADALAPLVRAHGAHGRALGGLPRADRVPDPARGEAAALAQVVRAEQGLADRVSAAVLEARSGALAAVLASVAASLTQHLTALADGAS